jgi:glucose-1-phosphate cytidylyltransferase
VSYFKEKSKVDEGWINGGFFVMEPEFLGYIKSDKTYLEREPLENATRKKQLAAFKHEDFWQCMDTKRDKDILEKTLKQKKYKKIFE